ncbi:LD-carboxypeptidase, partial [Candidatus Peregrinibacteria bacterium]|nr:LD-carboxypeptidase [Candidatus Peregrinibacteria bacterium]
YVSASAQERADDIHQMFSDNEIKAIICAIGGDHANQILKHIDFDLIRNNPKIFVGYSDISVLHYAFLSQADLQTFYGPNLMTDFGEYPKILDYTKEYFEKAVSNEGTIGKVMSSEMWTDEILDWGQKKDLERARKLVKSEGYKWLKEGFSTGEIVGGCVPSINHLIGTKYWVDPSNRIFFIDIPEGFEFGTGLSIGEFDSYLADLDNIGVFSSIKGLIVGRPYRYDKNQYEKLDKIIMKYCGDYNYPVLLNANIGHASPIITVPYLTMTELNSSENTFKILNEQ